MSKKPKVRTGLKCLCYSCVCKLYAQSSDPRIPDKVTIAVLLEYIHRQEQLCYVPYDVLLATKTSLLAAYAKNANGEFDEGLQNDAFDELVRRAE